MKRIFIIRRDLHLSEGKLAAMVGHLAEAYWTRLIKKDLPIAPALTEDGGNADYYRFIIQVPRDVLDKYVMGSFTKVILESKNKARLQRAVDEADKLGLKRGEDYDFINDNCLTELTPENPNGTTTIGIWFRPLEDDIARRISKPFQLYRFHKEGN